MNPSEALTGLRTTLAGHGIATEGMTLTRHFGTLLPDEGPCIGYHYGFFWWTSGRSRRGHALYAIHPATDPNGAARRLKDGAPLMRPGAARLTRDGTGHR